MEKHWPFLAVTSVFHYGWRSLPGTAQLFPLGFVAVPGAGPTPVCSLPRPEWKELCQSCLLMKVTMTHSPMGPYNRQGKKHLWKFSLNRVYVTGSAPAADPPSSHRSIPIALVRLRWHWQCPQVVGSPASSKGACCLLNYPFDSLCVHMLVLVIYLFTVGSPWPLHCKRCVTAAQPLCGSSCP